jgi:arsenical pump membrane protein
VLELVHRAVPVLGFLLGMTLLAELAGRAGLFRAVAAWLVRATRGSVPVLWLGVVLAAILCTALLSLDTTAVLLTPAVLALARNLRIDPRLFAYTCVWLSGTASLFLPVSNLTNLLALSGHSLPVHRFFLMMWLPGTVSVLVTVGLLALMFRRTLRGGPGPEKGTGSGAAGREGSAAAGCEGTVPAGRAGSPAARRAGSSVAGRADAGKGPCGRAGGDRERSRRDAALLGASMAAVAGLAVAILAGADIALTALCSAGALLAATAALDPRRLRRLRPPWTMLLGVGALFLVVQWAREAFLDGLLAQLAFGEDPAGLAGLAAGGALTANLGNNLPAYLALEGLAGASPVLSGALLIGVNAGSLIAPWGSLATLLWIGRCRAAGVAVSLRGFAVRGAVLTAIVLPASTLALALGPGA